MILDEIGRGTATFDGLSIAWATLEHLHDVNRCRALFATHYHEMTELADRLERAIGKLEEAVAARPSDGDGGAAATAELESLRAENADLKKRTAAVTERLDSAIDRLKSVLEA